MSRVDELKQRLQKVAYKGMGDVRKKGFEQSDNIGYFMHNKFNEPGIRDEIMSNVAESDKTCKNEATCGQSSRVMKKHFDEIAQGSGLRKDDVKEIAGTYTGPGAEHSQAVKYIKDKPVVGHEWLELPDESIVDASAGQFIDQKHGPLKQRHRFRIVPKESGLHKYYKKDKNLQQMIDTPEGREEINKIRKSLGLDTTPKGMKQVKLPNGKIITIPNKYAKLKQRLAYIGKTKYDKQLTNIQKEFEGMRPDILKRRHGTDMGKYNLPSHNEFGHLCTDEATCGATSSALFKKLGLDEGKSNVGFKNVKIEGGVYSGPGSEYSGAAVDTTDYKKRKRGESLSSEVGHEWIKLEDGTIVDGSSGQFMNQDAGIEDGKYKGREHRQNQRLRIIRPNDPLYKHYKGKYELDKFRGNKKWYDPKDPMKKHVDKLEKRMKSSKLKQRLAAIRLARDDWDKDEGINDPNPFDRNEKGGIDISNTEFMDRVRENSRRGDLHYKLKMNDEARDQSHDLYRELWDKINADSSIKDKEAEFRLRKPPAERVQPYKEFPNRTGYSSELGEELEERRGDIKSYNMKTFGRKKGFLGNSDITDLATIDQSYIEKNKLSKLKQRLSRLQQ